jgi:hypothetical protein
MSRSLALQFFQYARTGNDDLRNRDAWQRGRGWQHECWVLLEAEHETVVRLTSMIVNSVIKLARQASLMVLAKQLRPPNSLSEVHSSHHDTS